MSAPLVVERVTIGPQGACAKVPGLDVGYRLLTKGSGRSTLKPSSPTPPLCTSTAGHSARSGRKYG